MTRIIVRPTIYRVFLNGGPFGIVTTRHSIGGHSAYYWLNEKHKMFVMMMMTMVKIG